MITLIAGSMFSGKSTMLFQKLERAIYAGKKVLLIRPVRDNRGYFSHSNVDTSLKKLYENNKFDKYEVASFNDMDEMKMLARVYDTIFVDEYFMIENCKKLIEAVGLVDNGADIYFAGLISTSENKLFGETTSILPYCDDIIKLNGVCIRCGSELGNYSMYVGSAKKDGDIVVGDEDRYECVCRECYLKEKGQL